ncbi:MAG: endonuclease/exonuclease/phosphatase family protein [Candidatus Peregrinibacteria bacterium]
MNYKILLINLNYARGLNGTVADSIRRFYRYLYTSKAIQQNILSGLKGLITREQPDLCCLIEIEPRHWQVLADSTYPHGDVCVKYGPQSVVRHFPFHRTRCNGFLAKQPLAFKRHFLRHGTKKLVYEITLSNGATVFMGHFSLIASTRQKQFAELKNLITSRSNIIVCGDFNIFREIQELAPLLQDTHLQLLNRPTDKTFPAYRPRYSLDLFLASDTIQVKTLQVIDQKFSDHLPLILELSI